jgi:hypothetical protein
MPALSPEDAAKRDKYVHTLGNLTLVTKSLNGSLSNRPWTDVEAAGLKDGGEEGKGKWSLLDDFSLLVLNKEILQNAAAWADADISARNTRMAEAICAVWPGPSVVEPLATNSAREGASPEEELNAEPRVEASAEDVISEFNQAMQAVYVRAKQEAGYTASYYFEMLHQYGGLETAHRLLASSAASDGFTALWERRRLDLTVENVALRPEFQSLFTGEELDTARRRLADYGFDPES